MKRRKTRKIEIDPKTGEFAQCWCGERFNTIQKGTRHMDICKKSPKAKAKFIGLKMDLPK